MALPEFKKLLFTKKGVIQEVYDKLKAEIADIDAGIPEDDSITAAKLKTDSVETAKIKDLNVTTAKIAADAITNAKLADNAVQTENIADGTITAGDMAIFASTEQTGTGEAQNIAHGLAATPTIVMVVPSLNKDGADCSFSFTKGSANVVVTATTGAKYFVYAVK